MALREFFFVSPAGSAPRKAARTLSAQPRIPVPANAAFLKKFLREWLISSSPDFQQNFKSISTNEKAMPFGRQSLF